MIIKQTLNAHGYFDSKQMCMDFAGLIKDVCAEENFKHFIEHLRETEVEEILMYLSNMTSNKDWMAKKVTKRLEGFRKNGYEFWWEEL